MPKREVIFLRPLREQLDDGGAPFTLVMQPVKGRALGLAESVSADGAAVALLPLIVNLDVTFPKLPSGRTVGNRARYGLRVQTRFHSVVISGQVLTTEFSLSPFNCQKSLQAHFNGVQPARPKKVRNPEFRPFLLFLARQVVWLKQLSC